MASLTRFFGDRIPVSGNQLRELTNEPVPNHLKRWWFLLSFYYQASPETAYDSVRYITEEASYGWFIRSLHKWAATLMVASVILHQMRVYFTGAYRKPRELNWMVGMCLLICTLTLGFTGYSLVYEQLSYWGATVGANIADSVPVVGKLAKTLLLAGETYNERTLSRFFILHGAFLPVLMIFLLGIHITLIRLQGVTEFKSEKNPERDEGTFSFFPDHLLTEIIMGLVLMILLATLASIVPASMGPRANPLETPEVIKPEWFFYVAFRWLKLFSGSMAVLSMGLIVFLMFLWPFIDAWLEKRWPKRELSVWIGIVSVLLILTLTVWEAAVAH